jgi:hypothetical protein
MITIEYNSDKMEIKRGIAGVSMAHEPETSEDLIDSIHAAAHAGYDVLELRTVMVGAYLEAGHTAKVFERRIGQGRP